MSFNDSLHEELGMSDLDADAFYLEQEIDDELDQIKDSHTSLEQLFNVITTLNQTNSSLEDRRLTTAFAFGALSSHGQSEHFHNLAEEGSLIVSNEKLKGFLSDLYEKLIKGLKWLISTFTELLNRVTDLSSHVIIQAKFLRRQAEVRLGRSAKQPTFTVGREISRLVRGGTVPRTGEEVLKGLLETKRQLQIMLEDYPSNVISTGDRLISAFSKTNLSGEDYLDGVMECVNGLNLERLASALRVHPHSDSRFSKGEVVTPPPLLGGKSLFLRIDPQPYRSNPTVLSLAEARRTAGITLDWSDTSPPTQLSSAEMAIFGTNVVIQIAQTVSVIATMIYNSRSKASNAMIEKSKQVTRTLDQIKIKLENQNLTAQEQELYKAAFRYGLTFTRWVTSPLDTYCTHSLRVSRAAMSVSAKSLRHLN